MENFGMSEEEISVIRTVFDSCDGDGEGKIHINQFPGLLAKLGKNEEEVMKLTETASKVADENEGQLLFEHVAFIISQHDRAADIPMEGSDPKVIEFLRILEEYRIKCEEEGNYLEAGRAFKQVGVLRQQEEKRQQKVIQARQISERQDVQLAHNMQFSEFNKQWDKYMSEYDQMAQIYIQQMTERHAIVLLEFQKHLRQQLASKPPRWSKELIDQRRQQHINARNKNYAVAQKLKRESDRNEERERREMEQAQAIVFARREAKFRLQQQAELQALLKRIECRRKEHIKQRNLDTKRLLQRNRNVQAVLEAKQTAECQKAFSDIKKLLYSSAVLTGGQPANFNSSINNTGKVIEKSKRGSTKLPESPGSKARDESTAQKKYGDDSQLQRSSYEFSEETYGDDNDDYNAAANNFAQMQLDDDEFMREPPQQSLAFKDMVYSGDQFDEDGEGDDDLSELRN